METGSPGIAAAVGLSFLLIVGYLWGATANRRVRRVILRWAREGLAGLPEGATVRIYGTSGAVIRQGNPRAGIRDLAFTVLLEPREVPPVWLWERVRGRRDLVVLRIALSEAARADLEIAGRTSAFGRTAMAGLTEADGWKVVERGEAFTIAARRTRDAAALGGDLLRALVPAIPGLGQVSVRRGTQAVQVAFSLPAPPLGPMLDGLAAAARRLAEIP